MGRPVRALLIRPALAAWGLCFAAHCGAQMVLDGSLGTAGALGGPNFAIGANLGQQLGGNLFHSFSQFNVLSGQSATFSGPGSVSNIISRVTGSSASTIDGLLRSTISGANLYLLNPRGVMFGPNASLDVSGSFHVSTANYLSLGMSGRFDASNPGASVLTSAPPAAFGFLGPAPAPVSFNGSTLGVAAGMTLSVVGGDIGLSGAALWASGGRINLAATASAGEVTPGAAAIDTSSGQLGNITLTNSGIDVNSVPGRAAGTIFIRGGKMTMVNSTIQGINQETASGGSLNVNLSGSMAMDDGFISTWATGSGAAGDINLQAGRLSMVNGAEFASDTFSSGRSGNISVAAAESILIAGRNGAGYSSGVLSLTESAGAAGSISVSTPALSIAGGGILTSQSHGAGNAGNISVQTRLLSLSGGAVINGSTFGAGNGGGLTIAAAESIHLSDAVLSSESGASAKGNTGSILVSSPLLVADHSFISTQTGHSGNAGNIALEIGTLRLVNGAQANSSSFGSGRGGNVTVNASESIGIAGFSGGNLSGLLSSAVSTGAGGSIFVSAPLLLIDGGAIATGSVSIGNGGNITVRAGSARLINGGRLDASSFFIGNGGNIDLTVPGALEIAGRRDAATTEGILRDFVNDITNGAVNDTTFKALRPAFGDFAASGIVSRSVYAGDGGAIRVSAGNIAIGGGGTINASSAGAGRAGSIALDVAASLRLTGESGITTQGATSSGGNITIAARDLVYLEDSQITTSAANGQGNGGNISIDPIFVVLNNGQIIANAHGGNGGNINIVSEFFLASPDSLVQASSALGLQGTVTVTAPNVNLGAGLVALPGSFFDAASQMRASCSARAARGSNSFTGAARGGLPAGPEHFGFGAYSNGALALVGGEGMAATTVQLACLH